MPASPLMASAQFVVRETVSPPPGLSATPDDGYMLVSVAIPSCDAMPPPPGLGVTSAGGNMLVSKLGLPCGILHAPPGLALMSEEEKETAAYVSNTVFDKEFSEASTASDGFASDSNEDSSTADGEEFSEDGQLPPSQLSADAVSFVPSFAFHVIDEQTNGAASVPSPWASGLLEHNEYSCMTPMKVFTEGAVNSVPTVHGTCAIAVAGRAMSEPAQIVPTTSWVAAARAAMPRLCSKASNLRRQTGRCRAAGRKADSVCEPVQGRPSWASVVKAATPIV